MEPKQKARELFDKFKKNNKDTIFNAKKCALIAVDEIIESQPSVILMSIDGDETEYMDKKHYWQQVKQEIEAL
jgi:hypothetical protein